MRVVMLIFFCIGRILLIAQFNPEQIEIIRDQWGVPHIYAPTDPQVAYGLAWAHAEDDFNTIQQTMLAGKQMLAKHLGKDGAPIDYVVGLLRCEEIVMEHFSEVDSSFVALVAGYAAGLNAYAENHPDEVFVKKAFPLSVKDIFKTYVLQLAVQDGADNLISNLFEGNVDTLEIGVRGSNAFAFNRSKTSTGEVFLAVNSHQPYEGPAAWYEAHLVSDQGWNMLGGLFPGAPVIFHGTNEHLGWAHTVNYFDKIDVFQLEMHPKKKNLYRVDDQWIPLEKKKVKLKVKIFPWLTLPIRKVAYKSSYGPVVKNEKGVFAFHMGVFDDIRAIEQWYKMNKSTNLQEFKEALSMTAIPSFNIVYADKYDNIFYVGNGKIPLRDPAFDWTATVPGNISSTLPENYHPFEDLPSITNPTAGYLFNTNNGPFNASAEGDNLDAAQFDATMGFRKFENNRSLRFMELISQYDRVSWNDFLTIKYDQTLPDSLDYWIDLNPVFDLEPNLADTSAIILELIQGWNKEASVEQIGPAHLNILYRRLASKSDEIDIKNLSEEHYINGIKYVHRYLIHFFGTVNVTLGDYQKLIRGNQEYPIGGLPDVIAATNTNYMGQGKVQASSGESHILLIRYPKNGLPIIETVNVFGASNRPDSPHFDDQIPLFLNQERKKMTLDIEEVRKQAKRIYHPN